MILLDLRNLTSAIVCIALVGGTKESPQAENCSDGQTSSAPPEYMIIVTGGELLRGAYADSHTLFITRTLGPLGCRCVGAMCVGDDEEDLYDALIYSGKRSSLVIVTGGLGPTDDDITRETLSRYTGISLREDPDVVDAMMRRFGIRTRNELRKNLLRQTLTPKKGMYLPNPHGTAVGLVFEDDDQVVIALPGPPRELQPMVQDHVIPYLSRKFGTHSIGSSLTMRFVGIGESQIDQVMHEHLTLPEDLIISSLFEFGRVDLTLSLPGSLQADFLRLKAMEDDLLKYIGDYMYSDDGSTLEDCVIQILADEDASLVTAEVGSGGAIATSLGHAEGAPRVYSGGYVAPSDHVMANMLDLAIQTPSAPSETGAGLTQLIAERICQKADSEWGLVVSRVVEPENESRFVWVALGTRQKGFEIQRVTLRGHGETGQARLVNRCLDLLRRQLKRMQL